jgi:hypothetical protein
LQEGSQLERLQAAILAVHCAAAAPAPSGSRVSQERRKWRVEAAAQANQLGDTSQHQGSRV